MSQFSRRGTLPQYGGVASSKQGTFKTKDSSAYMGMKLIITIGAILGTIAFILHFTKKSKCKSARESMRENATAPTGTSGTCVPKNDLGPNQAKAKVFCPKLNKGTCATKGNWGCTWEVGECVPKNDLGPNQAKAKVFCPKLNKGTCATKGNWGCTWKPSPVVVNRQLGGASLKACVSSSMCTPAKDFPPYFQNGIVKEGVWCIPPTDYDPKSPQLNSGTLTSNLCTSLKVLAVETSPLTDQGVKLGPLALMYRTQINNLATKAHDVCKPCASYDEQKDVMVNAISLLPSSIPEKNMTMESAVTEISGLISKWKALPSTQS